MQTLFKKIKFVNFWNCNSQIKIYFESVINKRNHSLKAAFFLKNRLLVTFVIII